MTGRGEADGDGDGDGDGCKLVETAGEGVGVGEGVAVEEARADEDGATLAAGVGVGEGVAVEETRADDDGTTPSDDDSDGEGVGVAVDETLGLLDGETTTLVLMLGDDVGVAVLDTLGMTLVAAEDKRGVDVKAVSVGVGVTDADGEAVATVAVGVANGWMEVDPGVERDAAVLSGVGVVDADSDGEADRDGLGDGEADNETEGDGEAVKEDDATSVAVGDRVPRVEDNVGVTDGEAVDVATAVVVMPVVTERLGVTATLGVADTEGVEAGSDVVEGVALDRTAVEKIADGVAVELGSSDLTLGVDAATTMELTAEVLPTTEVEATKEETPETVDVGTTTVEGGTMSETEGLAVGDAVGRIVENVAKVLLARTEDDVAKTELGVITAELARVAVGVAVGTNVDSSTNMDDEGIGGEERRDTTVDSGAGLLSEMIETAGADEDTKVGVGDRDTEGDAVGSAVENALVLLSRSMDTEGATPPLQKSGRMTSSASEFAAEEASTSWRVKIFPEAPVREYSPASSESSNEKATIRAPVARSRCASSSMPWPVSLDRPSLMTTTRTFSATPR